MFGEPSLSNIKTPLSNTAAKSFWGCSNRY